MREYVIAYDIGGSWVRGAAIDLSGNFLTEVMKEETPKNNGQQLLACLDLVLEKIFQEQFFIGLQPNHMLKMEELPLELVDFLNQLFYISVMI